MARACPVCECGSKKFSRSGATLTCLGCGAARDLG